LTRTRFNTSHHWELFLEDADGQQVRFETPDGSQIIEVRGDFSATAPEDVPVGTAGPTCPSRSTSDRFLWPTAHDSTWRMVIDGETLPGA